MTPCTDHGSRGDKQGYAPSHGTRRHRRVYAAKMGLTMEQIKDVVVRHTCDNTRCINPEHLIGGTQADNMQDASQRNRFPATRPAQQALTGAQCAAIRKRYDPTRVGKAAPNGMTALAADYRVDRKVIYNVIKGTYVHS